MTLKERIIDVLNQFGRPASIAEIAAVINDKPRTTIRGRLNENINTTFKRIARGVYTLFSEDKGVLLVEGNGRDLSLLADSSISAIITDYPWLDNSHKGGNRNMVKGYEETTFHYTLEDFKEKYRVLKEGHFLIELLPSESASNFEVLYNLKVLALQAGFTYYSKVTWIQGTFVSNMGRKSKNDLDILFLVKGKARNLRPDKKRMKKEGGVHYMSGTAEMLPTQFNVQAVSVRERIHMAEKPVGLYEAIIELVTKPGELIVDQFAGSGNLGVAAINTNRFAIMYELLKDNVLKIKERISNYLPMYIILI
jgi:DNA modification methylase